MNRPAATESPAQARHAHAAPFTCATPHPHPPTARAQAQAQGAAARPGPLAPVPKFESSEPSQAKQGTSGRPGERRACQRARRPTVLRILLHAPAPALISSSCRN